MNTKAEINVPLRDSVLVFNMLVGPYHILWFAMLQAIVSLVHVVNLVLFVTAYRVSGKL